MPQSLLEQLPALVARGRQQAESILDSLDGRHRANLQTLERVRQSPDPRNRSDGTAFAQQQARRRDAQGDAPWTNRLIDGNSLQAIAALLAGDEHAPGLRGRIDLAYIDPPFAPEAVRRTGATLPHPDRQAPAAGQPASAGTWLDEAAYLAEIIPRLILTRELLSANGSIFVHLDWHVGHLVKLLLDDLFGKDNFRSEIVLPNQLARHLQIRRDHLFWYTKSAAASFPPLWIQDHAADGSESRWDHFWDTADRPAMRYSLFGITPTLGRWTWEEARALKAVRNYERFCEEGRGRTIEKYWCDTGATLEFLRPSPGDGVPQYWREPAGERGTRAAIPDGPDASGRLAGRNEAYLAQIIEFATAEHGIVAGFGGGSGPTAPVAERLGRRWLIAGLDKPACTIVRKRLIEQGARPFLYQAVAGG